MDANSPWKAGTKLVYTLEEVADILGISHASACKAAKRGEIPTIKLGRRLVRVPKAALEKLLTGRNG